MMMLVASLFSTALFAQDKWEASKDTIWRGQMGMIYKLDRNCNVLTSADGMVWSPMPEKMWQDKNNAYFKLENGSLTTSSDRNTWNPADKWTDIDGRAYKVERNCQLLTMEKALDQEQKVEAPYIKEKREYRQRMNKKIRDLDKQIASYRTKAGRVKRKNRPVVEQLEQQKGDLRAKMREMSRKKEAEWSEFKKTLDNTINTELSKA